MIVIIKKVKILATKFLIQLSQPTNLINKKMNTTSFYYTEHLILISLWILNFICHTIKNQHTNMEEYHLPPHATNNFRQDVYTKEIKMKKIIIVTPRQSNHHAYTLPAEISDTTERRLYMNVAQWALLQKKAVSSHTIAHQFQISARQATNILYIIHHRYADIIHSTVETVKNEGIIKNHIHVRAITPQENRRSPPKRNRLPPDNNSLAVWKNAFLMGGKNKTDKAKCPVMQCNTTPEKIWPAAGHLRNTA